MVPSHVAEMEGGEVIGLTVWFTGLSGSGKSTICRAVHEKLIARGMSVEILDGDDLRKTLTRDLGFTKADRDENIHRIGFVAHLLAKHGVVVLVAAISPYRAIREQVRQTVGNFIEVYVSAPLDICESRDPKGLYAKARSGELRSFTGIDDPYEAPLKPDVECRTVEESLEESRDKVIKAILEFYSRSDILIRYNTKRTGEDDLWRVIVDGVELLVSGFVIEGRVTDKISLNEQGETKYNVGCCGRVRIIDNIARIEAL